MSSKIAPLLFSLRARGIPTTSPALDGFEAIRKVYVKSERMPALFLGHGNPMNTLEHNRYTETWASLGTSLPRPRAILAISAHWYVNVTAVTAMEHPRTIHDFYGFPQALFEVQYPAPGDPELAAHVAEVVAPTFVGQDRDSWGLDHGTWSVLAHLYPTADLPVVQLSINAEQPLEYHLALGAALDSLRDEGVLIVASGNVVHNLGMLEWHKPGIGADWAERFDEATRALMSAQPGALASLFELPEARLAVPTPEHFLPLAYLAGLAAATGETTRTILEGYDYGSLSMTSYQLG
jgi:4,5-DOPA dioxygenase extradiol